MYYVGNEGCRASVRPRFPLDYERLNHRERLMNERTITLSSRRPRSRRVGARVFACLLLVAGCGESTVLTEPPPLPDGLPDASLTFLRPGSLAQPLLTTDTSFVATRGESIEIRLFYAPEPGSSDLVGERFLEFELDEESLVRYPPSGHPKAGQPFQDGDTITIRLHVETDTLLVELEPTGLQFDIAEPAELELRYGNADDDFDDDGESDPELEEDIDLWRQEKPGDPWFRVGEIKDADQDRVRARLTSFSRYALAI